MCRSEDSLHESGLSFQHVRPWVGLRSSGLVAVYFLLFKVLYKVGLDSFSNCTGTTIRRVIDLKCCRSYHNIKYSILSSLSFVLWNVFFLWCNKWYFSILHNKRNLPFLFLNLDCAPALDSCRNGNGWSYFHGGILCGHGLGPRGALPFEVLLYLKPTLGFSCVTS